MKTKQKLRRKRKPKTRRHKLEAETERLMSRFYQGLPCIVCGKTAGTFAHHIIPKGRCRKHRFTVPNLVPVCAEHHTGGYCAPHPPDGNPVVVDRFMSYIRRMQKRWAWVQEHADDCRGGWKPTIDDVEFEHEAWMMTDDLGTNYRQLCKDAHIEAYPKKP